MRPGVDEDDSTPLVCLRNKRTASETPCSNQGVGMSRLDEHLLTQQQQQQRRIQSKPIMS